MVQNCIFALHTDNDDVFTRYLKGDMVCNAYTKERMLQKEGEK